MELITLRSLEAARRFPQEVQEGAATKERGREHVCPQHGGSLVPTLVTTYGDAGDPVVWRAYPLAVDAWFCRKGEHIELAVLSTDEVREFLGRGGAAAQAGNLDEAEMYFRRVTSSWPGFASGRVNLGSVYLDRIKAEQARGGDSIERYRDVAIDQFERAIACKPAPPHRVWLMLAQLHVRAGNSAKTLAVLDDLASRGDLDAATREGMNRLMQEASASAPRPQAAPPRPAGPRFQHPYLDMTLPSGWRQIEAQPGLVAQFENAANEALNVVLMEVPAPADTKTTLTGVIGHHEKSVRGNYARCDAEPARMLDGDPTILEAWRTMVVQAGGPVWKIDARYAVTKSAVTMRDGRQVHPFAQIVHYGQAWETSTEVHDAIAAATLFPAVIEASQKQREATLSAAAPRLAPYLVTDQTVARRDAALRAAGRPAEGNADLIEVGYEGQGLYLTVAEETETQVSPLFPSDLRDRGLDSDEVLLAACERIGAMIGSEALPAQVFDVSPWALPPIWQPGLHAVVKNVPTVKVYIVGPSWMAAAAANCRELFDLATRALGSSRLRLLVPHRDRCFVFAEKSRVETEMLAAGILQAEAGAKMPLSNALFWLWPSGLETMEAPPSLEDVLFGATLGETRQQIEARWPRPDDWAWDEGRQTLQWRVPPTLEPFSIRYQMPAGKLRSIRVTAIAMGEYEELERLDDLLRAWLPHLPLVRNDGTPWSAGAARSQLAGKGAPGIRVASSVECDLGPRGWLFGNASAGKGSGGQLYGFDLSFHPGGKPAPGK